MTPQEFFDKENGTTYALQSRYLDDSARNQLADLAGEADEPCVFCNEPVRPNGDPRRPYWEFTADPDGEQPCHEECLLDAQDAAEEARGEARAAARDADSEADFNSRWPI